MDGVEIGGAQVNVNRAIIEYGTERQLVYYWFQQRGRVITNEYLVKWYLFWDSLTRSRTDGALVRLITRMPDSDLDGAADRELAELASAIAPMLEEYVPG